jgi:hypothetical protein
LYSSDLGTHHYAVASLKRSWAFAMPVPNSVGQSPYWRTHNHIAVQVVSAFYRTVKFITMFVSNHLS